MAELLNYFVVLAWALCAAGIAWYCLNIARQITYVTLADGRQQERKLPLVFRLLLPFAPNLYGLVARPSFEKARITAERDLVAAGFEGLLSGQELVTLKLLMPTVCGLLWFVALKSIATIWPDSEVAGNFGLLLILGIVLLYFYPLWWLRRALSARGGVPRPAAGDGGGACRSRWRRRS